MEKETMNGTCDVPGCTNRTYMGWRPLDQLAFGECPLEGGHLRNLGRPVAAQRQRPDARVDEEAQSRERSRL